MRIDITKRMLLNRTLYTILVALLAFSPLISMMISDMLIGELSFYEFIWVGVALSLPITLLIARALGKKAYLEYWNYLESFPNNTKARIIIFWVIITVFLMLIGLCSIFNK